MFTKTAHKAFCTGKSNDIYRKLGAHVGKEKGVSGTRFSLWAPHAASVWLRLDGTDGQGFRGVETAEDKVRSFPMGQTQPGIWEIFVPGVGTGTGYRFDIRTFDGRVLKKADPMAFATRKRPSHMSLVWDSPDFPWEDDAYFAENPREGVYGKPMFVYEVHLGSWKKDYRLNEDGFLNYRRIAEELRDYVLYMGFTHVELIGICEHPFDGSWGYQATGFYSPTSRYGSPDDFRYFVNVMHKAGIGVILDWVPAHFARDDFGLAYFDGQPLYESEDPLLAEYPEWGTNAFDHGKPEVKSFLVSNACYWIREFHVDALRVDAVAAMLSVNFSRAQWRPNKYGGTDNLDSIAFLQTVNETVRKTTGGYLIAEDSSIRGSITVPVSEGGLGFWFKWNMGWMNDILHYFGKDPIFRGYHHGEMTHTVDYAFDEHYVLPLSHDEVVHLKKPMLEKMPGPSWEKFGGLKALYTFQAVSPGKKLLFMGQEFAEDREWDENRAINWAFPGMPDHRDVMECLRSLIKIYKKYPCLYTDLKDHGTFEWINRDDAMRSTVSFLRRNPWNYRDALLVICNFTPVDMEHYLCGAPVRGKYQPIFSTYDSLPDNPIPAADTEAVRTKKTPCDGRNYAISYHLRPYEAVIFEVRGC